MTPLLSTMKPEPKPCTVFGPAPPVEGVLGASLTTSVEMLTTAGITAAMRSAALIGGPGSRGGSATGGASAAQGATDDSASQPIPTRTPRRRILATYPSGCSGRVTKRWPPGPRHQQQHELLLALLAAVIRAVTSERLGDRRGADPQDHVAGDQAALGRRAVGRHARHHDALLAGSDLVLVRVAGVIAESSKPG